MDEILQLHLVRFRSRDDPEFNLNSAQDEVGFIAQKVREAIPDAVTEEKQGYMMTLNVDPVTFARRS